MKSLLLVLLTLSLLSGGFRIFAFWQIDEAALAAQVVPSAPVRLLQRTDDQLAALRERLVHLDVLDADLLEPHDASNGGRKRLFLPDKALKTLGLSL